MKEDGEDDEEDEQQRKQQKQHGNDNEQIMLQEQQRNKKDQVALSQKPSVSPLSSSSSTTTTTTTTTTMTIKNDDFDTLTTPLSSTAAGVVDKKTIPSDSIDNNNTNHHSNRLPPIINNMSTSEQHSTTTCIEQQQQQQQQLSDTNKNDDLAEEAHVVVEEEEEDDEDEEEEEGEEESSKENNETTRLLRKPSTSHISHIGCNEEQSVTESIPNGSSSCVNIQIEPLMNNPHNSPGCCNNSSNGGDRGGNNSNEAAKTAAIVAEYAVPRPVHHPLEENVVSTFLRAILYYTIGFAVAVPIIALCLALIVVIVPFRMLAYVMTRLSVHGLYSKILARKHCDPWWPIMSNSKKGTMKGSVAFCVATVQGTLRPNELAQSVLDKLISLSKSGYATYALWTWCQTLTGGPLSLMLAAVRSPPPLWSALNQSNSNNAHQTPNNKRKSSLTEKKQKKYRVSMGSSNGGGSRHSSASIASPYTTLIQHGDGRKLTWARVPAVDQIFRAERILRASTVELVLAFVAGSFRRYFKSHGIRFPPDIQISMPVSCRELTPISKNQECDFVVVPITLPSNIEGCIPRVWEVQRCLTDALESPFPHAMRASTSIGDLLLPSSWNRKLQLSTHSASTAAFTYLQCAGEGGLSNRKIHSMLFYQPMMNNIHAGFTFIQSGSNEMVVSLTVDQAYFPDADSLLTGFQCELQSLLKQLAIRMMTLSQVTFLPSPLMAKFNSTGNSNNNNNCSNQSTPQRHQQQQKTQPQPPLLHQRAAPPSSSTSAHHQQFYTQSPTNPSGLPMPGDMVREQQDEGGDGSSSLPPPPPPASARSSSWKSGHSSSVDYDDDDLLAIDDDENGGGGTKAEGGLGATAGGIMVVEPEESLEDLESLLTVVQREIVSLKSNPRGRRSVGSLEAIAKLSELESKMERFHRRIAERLSSKRDSSEVEVSLDAFLQPYRDEATNEGHDGSRRGSGFNLRRKRSKRVSSPTRISPNPGGSRAGSQQWESSIATADPSQTPPV